MLRNIICSHRRGILLVIPFTLVTLLLLSGLSGAQAPYPPAPQMETILPESWSIFTGEVNFIYDFRDFEKDIQCLKIDIMGPFPYNTTDSKISLIFSANETDPWSMMDNSSRNLFQNGMGIDVTYYNSTERWVITINTTKLWNITNPWSQPNGTAVWPSGLYIFDVEVDDKNGSRWGNLAIHPEYARFYYSFHKIQPAIDGIGSGGTIHVLQGVYDEKLTINKSITLIGSFPDTIFRPTFTPSPTIYDIEIVDGADNTIIRDFVLDFDGTDGTRDGNGILIGNTLSSLVTGIRIINNIIYTGDASSPCIATYPGCDVSNLTIENNVIYGYASAPGGGIYIASSSGTGKITIYSNEIYGKIDTGIKIESSNVCVSCNVIDSNVSGGSYGIIFTDQAGGNSYNNVSIVSNKIKNFTYGIKLGTDIDSGSSLYAIVGSNDITGNDIGLIVGYGFLGDIHKNNIFGNINYGIQNIGSTVVNATLNWWGNSTGPYHPTSNPGGTGDNVSDNVDFSNWLTSEWENVVWVDDFYDPSTPGWGIDHFNNINDAINAVFDGGKVNVKPANYYELIRIDKPLTLKSVYGFNLTIISDAGANYSEMQRTKGQTIQIASNHIIIDGFTIRRENYGAGDTIGAIGNVGYPDIHDIVIKNCYIYSIHDGVHFRDASDITISSCERIVASWKGVYLNSVNGFTIKQNLMDLSGDTGILVYNSSHGDIEKDFIKKKTTGVFIRGCSDVVIDSEKVYNNTNGIFIENSTDVTVRYSSIYYNTYGLRLSGFSKVVETGNGFLDNEYAIYHAVSVRNVLYSSIQDGVNFAGVGDSITVYYGEYRENVTIDKTVTLEGYVSPEKVIINGTGSNATIYVGKNRNATDVVIRKMTIIGGNSCIRTGRYMNVSGLKIEKCIIKEPEGEYAVYIDPHQNPDYPPIRPGAQPFPKPVALYDNTIRGGVYYQYTPFELYGIPLSCQLSIFYNDIDKIYINGSISVIVDHNVIHEMVVRNTYDITITNNQFVNPSGVTRGLCLISVEGENQVKKVNISHNIVVGYDGSGRDGIGEGILLLGCTDTILEGNHIEANINGIVVAENYDFEGLNCTGNVGNIKIINNSMVNCYTGVKLLSGVDHITIDGNFIASNGYGIWIQGANNNTISGNTIKDEYYGLKIDENSSHNLIYNNYFANNTINAQDLYSFNIWNISLTNGTNIMGGDLLGGNYWDDYTGEDIDGDGIGDTAIPYNASGNIKNGGDYLPIIFADNVPPIVRVIYPNGGEIINNDTILIEWEASDDKDPSPSIDIYYSNDSGQTWSLIVPNISNSKKYLWNISHLEDGCDYIIKIVARDNAGNEGNDTSDDTFCIAREVTGAGPEVKIIKPKMGFLYFFDVPRARFFRNNIFIIGQITIEAKVNSTIPLQEVRFYIDDDLVNITTKSHDGIYSWEWDEVALFYHEIKVTAIDVAGRSHSATLGVTIFNLNIIP